jgi:hypothetical protein
MVHALCLSVGIVVCSDFMLCLINCDAMLHAMYMRTVISALMFTMSVRYIHMRRYSNISHVDGELASDHVVDHTPSMRLHGHL